MPVPIFFGMVNPDRIGIAFLDLEQSRYGGTG